MNAASGLPGRTTGRGAHTTAYTQPQATGLLSRSPDYRLAGTRVKDASGAAVAAGLRPVLDPAARSHGIGSGAGKQTRGQFSMPCKQHPQRETAGRNPA